MCFAQRQYFKLIPPSSLPMPFVVAVKTSFVVGVDAEAFAVAVLNESFSLVIRTFSLVLEGTVGDEEASTTAAVAAISN